MLPPRSAADSPGADGLLSRLEFVAGRVREAAVASGRDPDSVQLLLATKTVESTRIRTALAAGFRLIGENRVQEVVAKAPELATIPHECHFIGHLQVNKINQLLPHVSCVQTVDSADLARRLSSRAELLDRTLDVFVQVNVSGEASKSGVAIDDAPALLATLARYSALRVKGYMTIGLNSPDLAAVRAGYRALTAFRDLARARGMDGAEHAVELSMGMSGDFVEAISEGATMVRLGSGVFGARPPIGPTPV